MIAHYAYNVSSLIIIMLTMYLVSFLSMKDRFVKWKVSPMKHKLCIYLFSNVTPMNVVMPRKANMLYQPTRRLQCYFVILQLYVLDRLG